MDYKAIRFIGFFGLLLSAVFGAAWLWERFGAGGSTESAAIAQSMWLVFLFVGTLTGRVASVLERQADEIASLRRRLPERPEAKAGL